MSPRSSPPSPAPSSLPPVRGSRSNWASVSRLPSDSSPGSSSIPNMRPRRQTWLRRSGSAEASMRVTNRADKPLGDLVEGVRRAIFFDAAEGSAQLSFGAVEIDPGKEIPVHRHKIGDRYVEEGFFVLEGEGEVRVGEQASPIRAPRCQHSPPSPCRPDPFESARWSLRTTGGIRYLSRGRRRRWTCSATDASSLGSEPVG